MFCSWRKHGGEDLVVIKMLKLVNLGKGVWEIPLAVHILADSLVTFIYFKIKVTPKCQQCFFFLIVYLFC